MAQAASFDQAVLTIFEFLVGKLNRYITYAIVGNLTKLEVAFCNTYMIAKQRSFTFRSCDQNFILSYD